MDLALSIVLTILMTFVFSCIAEFIHYEASVSYDEAPIEYPSVSNLSLCFPIKEGITFEQHNLILSYAQAVSQYEQMKQVFRGKPDNLFLLSILVVPFFPAMSIYSNIFNSFPTFENAPTILSILFFIGYVIFYIAVCFLSFLIVSRRHYFLFSYEENIDIGMYLNLSIDKKAEFMQPILISRANHLYSFHKQLSQFQLLAAVFLTICVIVFFSTQNYF